jgi:ABC-type Fe3+-hydroxamate transport system substrate-binding protein
VTNLDTVDALGCRHERARGEVRIVSLVPSLTELLFELGLGPNLVGRTGFCIHPREGVRGVPKVGGTKDVDVAKVRAVAPSHLVVNVDENAREVVDELRAFVPSVIVTHPIEVEDNFGLYTLFGRVFDREERAAALCGALQHELDAVRAVTFDELRVLYLIWRRPWMTIAAHTYIARMLATVGLRAVAPPSTARYPEVDLGEFGALRCDAVLLSSEPYRFAPDHVRELRAELRDDELAVLAIDGEMTSWYGSRAIAGLRYLREFRRSLDLARAGADVSRARRPRAGDAPTAAARPGRPTGAHRPNAPRALNESGS